MESIFDRVGLAFMRVFGDLAGGNISDILLSDFVIVFLVVAVPMFMVGTMLARPRM